jgi:hypothetical protein
MKIVTMNTTRAIKIGLAWVNIVWVVCYLVIGLVPRLGPTTLSYLLHVTMGPMENIFTIGNFLIGLILWNIIVAAGVALVGVISNYIKD